MISAKAGLVNYVDGQANVHLREQVIEGAPIETQAPGHVEVLLTPGSFLRLGNDSIAVLDSVELDRVAIRLLEGTALIEVGEIDKHTPIRITSGNLRAMISKRGIYRFSGNTASVIDGKLEIVDTWRILSSTHQTTNWIGGVKAGLLPWRMQTHWRITTARPAHTLHSVITHTGMSMAAALPGSTVRCWAGSRLFHFTAIDRITGTVLFRHPYSRRGRDSRRGPVHRSADPSDRARLRVPIRPYLGHAPAVAADFTRQQAATARACDPAARDPAATGTGKVAHQNFT
jgi:hypothetical protein